LIHIVAEGVAEHAPEIEGALTEAGIAVRAMDVIPPSLEDVFIASARESRTG
jgi:hypothetical protein